MRKTFLATGVLSALIGCTAQAATVSLGATVLNSCVLTIPVSGVMVADAAGTTLRSDSGVGARAATLTIAALGASPTLTFAVPQYSGPSGVSADAVQYYYAVAGTGASRGFAATSATASSRLIDTVTINGKIDRAEGFPTGSYAMTVDVTCGQ